MNGNGHHRKIYLASIAALALGYATVLYIGYLALWPVQPVTISTLPVPVETKTVRQSDTLVYIPTSCRNTDAPMNVMRYFVDGIEYAVPTVPFVPKPYTCGPHRIPIVIPENLPPGEYHLVLEVRTQLNPIRTITQRFDTETFTVIAR